MTTPYDPNDPFSLPPETPVPPSMSSSSMSSSDSDPNGSQTLDISSSLSVGLETAPGSMTPNIISSRLQGTLLRHFNEVTSALGLVGEQRALALKWCEQTDEASRFITLVCLTLAHNTPAPVAPTPPPAHHGWFPTDAFKEYTRRICWIRICDPRLESYSQVQIDGEPITSSLESTTVRAIAEESAAFFAEHLNLGLPTKLATVTTGPVFAHIRDQLKYARQNLRSILLNTVSGPGGTPVNKPIHTLAKIIGKLVRSSEPGRLHETDYEIMATVSMRFKMRVALMRLITVHVFKFPLEGRRQSQWNLIDTTIRDLSQTTPLYQQAYYSLILQQDARLFNGEHTYGDLCVREDFNLPRDSALHDEMAAIAARVPSLATHVTS